MIVVSLELVKYLKLNMVNCVKIKERRKKTGFKACSFYFNCLTLRPAEDRGQRRGATLERKRRARYVLVGEFAWRLPLFIRNLKN